MKKVLSLLAIVLLSATMTFAANVKKESFKVYGSCDMCKERIEKAATDIKGVSTASWDKATKMIAVEYDKDAVKLTDVHKAIAKVGHDTDKVLAKNATYDKLHSCCKYERSPKAQKSSCCDSKTKKACGSTKDSKECTDKH